MSEENNVQMESTEPMVEQTTSEQTETTPSYLDTFEYSFDKEQQKVASDEELRELVEMGRYYKEKGKDGDDWLKSYAKENNMSKSELLEAFKQQKIDQSIEQIAETEYVPIETAKELYEGRILKESTLTKAEEAKEQKRLDENYAEFVKEFPDVKDVPEEVMARFAKGDISLADAYKDSKKDSTINELTSRLAELEEKLGITTKNADNAAASTGSVTGNGQTDSVFSKAQVDNMSKADVKKNYNKIIQDMKTWRK